MRRPTRPSALHPIAADRAGGSVQGSPRGIAPTLDEGADDEWWQAFYAELERREREA